MVSFVWWFKVPTIRYSWRILLSVSSSRKIWTILNRKRSRINWTMMRSSLNESLKVSELDPFFSKIDWSVANIDRHCLSATVRHQQFHGSKNSSNESRISYFAGNDLPNRQWHRKGVWLCQANLTEMLTCDGETPVSTTEQLEYLVQARRVFHLQPTASHTHWVRSFSRQTDIIFGLLCRLTDFLLVDAASFVHASANARWTFNDLVRSHTKMSRSTYVELEWTNLDDKTLLF